MTLEHNCIIKKHKIERLPQVSRLRHFAVCTKNTENIEGANYRMVADMCRAVEDDAKVIMKRV